MNLNYLTQITREIPYHTIQISCMSLIYCTFYVLAKTSFLIIFPIIHFIHINCKKKKLHHDHVFFQLAPKKLWSTLKLDGTQTMMHSTEAPNQLLAMLHNKLYVKRNLLLRSGALGGLPSFSFIFLTFSQLFFFSFFHNLVLRGS